MKMLALLMRLLTSARKKIKFYVNRLLALTVLGRTHFATIRIERGGTVHVIMLYFATFVLLGTRLFERVFGS
jgi:hypothetical protein